MQGDYIGPERQLMPPRDVRMMEALQEIAQRLKAIIMPVWDAIKNAFSSFANILINVFKGVSWPPTRSRLRLHRHKSHEERRIAWRVAHPAVARKISHRRGIA